MRRCTGMGVLARVATLVLLAGGSVFALDITVTNATYGATPDDGTNDAPAFISALNAIADAGGGTLTVPCGNYDLTNKVTVDLHAATVVIAGDGADVTTFRCTSNNTDGVFLFNNNSGENQLTLKDFTIEANQFGGTAVGVFNPSLSTNPICSLRMDNVVINPATGTKCYFIRQVDAANLKSPVFFNVLPSAGLDLPSLYMEGFHIENVDSPTFDQTYTRHISAGYTLTGMRGAANFIRAYASGTAYPFTLQAVPGAGATLSMRHFHSSGATVNINAFNFDRIDILQHLCYADGRKGVPNFDYIFTDCANVTVRGTIFHVTVSVPHTMISLKGTTHNVHIANCIFRSAGATVLQQDPEVRGVSMVGSFDVSAPNN